MLGGTLKPNQRAETPLLPLRIQLLIFLGFIFFLLYHVSSGVPLFKGGLYILLLAFGATVAHFLSGRSLYKLTTSCFAYMYPVLLLVCLTALSIAFFALPLSLMATNQTRELGVFSALLISNFTVEDYYTSQSSYILGEIYSATTTPLGQTWLISLSVQLIVILTLTSWLVGKATLGRFNVVKVNIILTAASGLYWGLSSINNPGVMDFKSSLYIDIAPWSLYWVFGIGFILYTENSKSLKNRIIIMSTTALMGLGVYFINYQVSYLLLIIAFTSILITNKNSQYGVCLTKFNNYILLLIYPTFLVIFIVLPYSKSLMNSGILILLTSIVLSVFAGICLSKFFVKPIYYRLQKYPSKRQFFILVVGGLCTIIIIVFGYTNQVLVKVQPNSWLNAIVFTEECNNHKFDSNPLKYIKFSADEFDFSCSWDFGEGNKKLLVIGNSSAVSLLDGIVEGARAAGWNVDSYAAPNCHAGLPSMYNDDYAAGPYWADKCREISEIVLKKIENNEYDAVLTSSVTSPLKSLKENIKLKEYLLNKGIPVIINDSYVKGDAYAGRNTIFLNRWSGERSIPAPPEETFDASLREYTFWQRKLFDGAILLHAYPKMCNESSCVTARGGVELYSDLFHLSKKGSLEFASLVKEALRKANKEIDYS